MSILQANGAGLGGAGDPGGALSSFYSTTIDQSLRFPNTDSGTGNAYLNRTPSSASNRRTWTWSAWVKRSKLGNGGANQSQLIWAAFDGGDADQFQFGDTNNLRFYLNDAVNANIQTTAVYRDVSSWYHIVLAVDTTQATAADRVSIYVNGEEVTDLSSSTYPTQNYQTDWNSNVAHTIGQSARINSTQFFCGYMAEVNFIDGTALDATSFGETINGIWVPKQYSGSYGTNGFYLSFADSSAIGDDLSGNTNDWTANNLAASDVVPDSPTNNFPTYNSIYKNLSQNVLSEGALQNDAGSGYFGTGATMAVKSGKWYCEVYMKTITGSLNNVGIDDVGGTLQKEAGYGFGVTSGDHGIVVQTNNRRIQNNAINTQTGLASWSSGDIVGMALDLDSPTKTLQFYKNNVAYGTAETISTSAPTGEFVFGSAGHNAHTHIINFGQDSTFAGATTAGGNADDNGYGDFKYAPPSGFLALCSANLPEPTISPNAAEQADDYFNTVLYTGDGSTSHAITGVGFQPDLVWIKRRNNGNPHFVNDSVRGATKDLRPDATDTETTNNQYGILKSFDSDGFTVSVGSTNGARANTSGGTFVAWNWKAGGAAVSNTDGSITSSVSAAPDAGFSICTYTGTATVSESFGHGLNQAPELVITKARSVGNAWRVHGSVLGTDKFLALNGTGSVGTDSTNGGFPDNTDTVVNVGYESETGVDFVAYCFHSVLGYSSVGSYVGNGSADGTFVYTGFRPAWLMVKRTGSGGWHMFDNKRAFAGNEIDVRLEADNSDAENTGGPPHMDFLSSGFKMRTSFDNMNASGNTYIYLAFAEAPFKYANAR